MRLTNWLSRLARQRPGSRRFIRRKRNADTAQAVELLEDRTLLAAPHPFVLSTLDGSNGFRLDGIDDADYSGSSLSTAGDFNGDGYDDILVGASYAGAGETFDAGETYVVFGSGNGSAASLGLSTLDGSNGFRLDGIDAGDWSGHSVSTAGDVNGDGYADILVGGYGADGFTGETYVVFGSGSAFAASLDLSTLDGSNGFRLDGIAAGDRSGISVSTAGDVNGDGYDDILVGAPYANAGATYVVFGSGSEFASRVDLSTLDGDNGFRLDGIVAMPTLGNSVSTAGDFNGDSYADILVGAFRAGSNSGEMYVIFGSGSGFASSMSVDTLDGSNGLRLNGIDAWHNSGEEVSTAGDVNGDGYDDILVGARRANNSTGQTYVVFGSGSGFAASLDLSTLDGSNGFRLDGIDVEDYSGISVSTAGDVNGDGYDDMLVGAYRADRGGAGDAGETYVIFGTDSGFAASLNLSTLDGSNGIRLDGTPLNDKSGSAVSTAGDINGDGYADILVGAPQANSSAGKTYVVFGGDFTESVTHAGTSADDTLTGDATANVIVSGRGNDTLDGRGGADVLYAAEGDDVLLISDTGFHRVDGGSGNDTLVLDGSGITLDLTTIADNKLTGIELIDITGSGDNSLTVDVLEVLNLSDTSNTLVITWNVGDTIDIGSGWTHIGTETIAGSLYQVVTQRAATVKLLAHDYGDAPSPYPTTLSEDGPRHSALGPTLGSNWDSEINGTHSSDATADDTSGSPDDEDGVTFGALRVGQIDATTTVNVQNAPSGAKLDAWMDFNGDGSWGGPGEQIFASQAVVNGDNSLTFDVPSWAASGTTYARVRLSTAGALGVTRSASDGEVEDYEIEITPPVAASGVFGGEDIISSTADGAVSVFSADVDGDGDMDVLSASQDDDTIAWYENDGSQNFTQHIISTDADRANTVFAADVDGDGDLDVLSASMFDDRITWYENDGTQNFTAHTISADANFATDVFAADVDNDGDLDILSASYNDDKISWYENDGSQNFTERIVSSNADEARSVFAIDVDGDGDLDVLSASELDDKIAWYENDGNQTFTERVLATSADRPTSVFATDVDGDGDIDVLSASWNDDKIAWYENDGSQNFTERVISTIADEASHVFAADLDGDGDIDVLSASYNDDKIAWYENDGSQGFTAHTVSTTADMAKSVFAADVDGDGDLDILSASFGDEKIVWYENNATPTLDPTGDLAIDEDAAEQTVNLAGIGSGGGESQPLRVITFSSDTGLIPDPTVTYTSANTTGSLKFTPVSDQSGTATITVTVEDGGLDNDLAIAGDNATFSRTFDVTVNAVNDVPTGSVTISGLPVKGQTLTASNNLDDEDGLGTISYQWKRGNSITAWGQNSHGGNSAPTDSGYTQVFSTFHAFAALKSDGTIIAWGWSEFGGSGAPTDSGYTQLFSTDTAFAGLKSDGSITAWGQYESGGGYAPTDSGYTQLFSAQRAFAALKSDGSITAWGHIDYGGSGAPTDSGYTNIFSTRNALAALKSDGSITAWGYSDGGGSGAPTDSGYTKLFSTYSAFAALKSDGSITAWGHIDYGGSGAPTDSGYTQIVSTSTAFAALKSDGSITAWGDSDRGGSGAPTDSGYTQIFSAENAFAALKSDGSITAWGDSDRGGNGAPTDSGYTQLFSTYTAFAALKSDGSISAWGKSYEGGPPGIPTDSGYTQIFSNAKAFAALKSDGSITAWGTAYWGGPPGVPTDSGYTQLFSNTRAFVALKPEVIPGATETTYTLAEADAGLVITVTASYTDGEGTAESVTSDALGVTRAPTLDAISDLTIDEDAAEQTVSFTGITAGAEETQPLRVSAASSSTGLIPNPTVTYTSADATGSLKFTSVSDHSGTATITVIVEDGGLDGDLNTAADNATFSRTFDVTVNAVNDLPLLDTLSNVVVDEDATEQTVSLNGIGAGGGESQPLQVTASSSDTGLVPDPTVTYTSANATGSVAFTPVSDQSGTATITVTVKDGGLDNDLDTAADNATFSRTFDVTVNAIDDPPVLASLPDLSVEEDDRIHNDDGIDFDNFVSDVDSDISTTEFRIVNIGEIDSDFDVSIDMANDSGNFSDRSNNTFHAHPEDDFNGSTVVTIEARDAQGNVSAQQSFTLTVTAVNDVPVAVADNYSTNEDEQLALAASGVLANDSDIENDPLTAMLVTDVSDGTLSLASDGGFTYTPDAGFHGSDSFTYKANDGSDDGNTVTVNIDVIQHPEIHGTLLHDLDSDGSIDAGEPGLAGWTVFLDTSDDGILDAGESSTTTLADVRGNYSFTDLVPGDYTVAWITPTGWQATTSSQSLTLAAGDVREDVDLFDQFIVSATPTITSVSFADDGIADTFRIGPNGSNVEVTVNGNVTVRKPVSELTSITVNGSGDDDTLIVDLGGLDASLGFAADLIFNGNGDGSDNDTLQLINGSAANIAYSFANATDGTITIDDSSIEFSGLEPILDSLTTDHREFTFATTDDVITLSDDGISDNGLMTLSSVSSSETVTFANPGTSMGIHLGSGADQLTVVSLDDGFAGTLTLNGEGGDDTIDASTVSVAIKQNGSGGNDILRGGSGNDTLNGGSGSDSLEGGAGNDRLQGQGGSYDTLSGGPGDDTLDGGDGYDRIFETADVDFTATDSSLTGLGSDTLINIQLVQLFGGSSSNTINTSAFTGRAFLNGSGGHDTLTGGGWYDRIFGGSGRDLITGGDSVVDPETGSFTYDVLRGQGGNNDTLIGGAGDDKLNGGAGHDSLIGGGGDDVLTGESGDDTLNGGAGTDRLYERANVDMTLTDANLSGGLGSDDLTSIETAYLKGGNSNNRLNASAFSGAVTLIGVGGNDTLRGGAGNDMLNGRSGNDSITGGDGDDTLKGLRDNDTLNGGAGDDWLDGGTQDDSISGWTGDDVLYGRSGNDILVGGDGHDSLYGASGDDLLQGDDGKTDTSHERDDDRLDGGDGTDTVRGGDGTDTKLDDASEIDESFAYWAEWVDAV